MVEHSLCQLPRTRLAGVEAASQAIPDPQRATALPRVTKRWITSRPLIPRFADSMSALIFAAASSFGRIGAEELLVSFLSVVGTTLQKVPAWAGALTGKAS